MVIDRRTFTFGLTATALSGTIGKYATASARTTFITSARDRLDGRFKAVGLDHQCQIVWQETLPDRAHAPVLHPNTNTLVIIARRPGHFAEIRSVTDGQLQQSIAATQGRHFYGHGTFDQTGRYLFLTENDFEGGKGIIGIYDAFDHYKRLDEISSGGIGPHEITLMPNGHSLVVANGGIRTHPDHGRDKLNLDTMTPSLQFIDIASGQLEQSLTFSHSSLNRLSVRHMAVLDNDHVAVGCQDQSSPNIRRNLVYMSDSEAGMLRPLPIPKDILAQMSGYVGSMSVSGDQRTIAASCPRGGVVVLWDAHTGKYSHTAPLDDVCGLASTPNANTLIATSGQGKLRQIDQNTKGQKNTRHPFLQWDNHIITATLKTQRFQH